MRNKEEMKMKENKMLEPEIEFVKFLTTDVITTSGGGSDVPPVKNPMKNGGNNTEDDYKIGIDFDDPLQ